MARARNLDELLDFESRWDEALALVLAPLGLPVHTGFDPGKLEAPCLSAVFTFLGEAATSGGRMPQVRGGLTDGQTYNQVSYRGRAQVELHVHRGAQTRETLAAWRGGVRRLFLPQVRAFNSTTLPFYAIASITVAEGDRLTDESRDLDVVVFRYEFVWGIIDSAWPNS